MKIVNSKHNHTATSLGAHSVLKRLAITREIQNEMARQLIIQTALFKILVKNSTATNLIFIVRDVYNFQTQLRLDELEFPILIQALICEFERNNWMYKFQKNDNCGPFPLLLARPDLSRSGWAQASCATQAICVILSNFQISHHHHIN